MNDLDMYSKYDHMHKNVMFYVLIYINNHVVTSISCMLSDFPPFIDFRNVNFSHKPLYLCLYLLTNIDLMCVTL